MSTPTTRQPRVPAGEARRRILRAAERLLAADRYRDLTVDVLMSEAGLARTVFYRHFDGLPAVVLELLAGVGDELAAIVDDETRDAREILEGVVAVYAEHGQFMRAVDDVARVDDAVQAAYEALFAGHVERTAAQLDADRHGIALALHLMNRHYLIETLGRDPSFDRATAVDALWTVWARTLGIDG